MAAFSEEAVENIVSLDKASGRQQIAEILKLKEYDEESDLKAAIYIDFLYDNIHFTAEKGFSWSQVAFIALFAQKYLQECQGLPLSEAVLCYKENSEGLASILGERNFKVYTDYIFSTFLSHYQLFHYVFSRARQTNAPNVELDVNVPVPPEEFKQGKGEQIWLYEKKIEEMEKEEKKKSSDRALMKARKMEEEEYKKQVVQDKISSTEGPLTKESLEDLIKEVLQSYTSSVLGHLASNIQDTREDLELMLGKTSVPRPQVLGPPPRFKARTPVTANKSANKSRPNKSRDSARSGGKSPKSAKSKT